jgi:hypothetical protein
MGTVPRAGLRSLLILGLGWPESQAFALCSLPVDGSTIKRSEMPTRPRLDVLRRLADRGLAESFDNGKTWALTTAGMFRITRVTEHWAGKTRAPTSEELAALADEARRAFNARVAARSAPTSTALN